MLPIRSLLALVALQAALPALANSSLTTTGYGLTVGPVYSRANLGSATYNPANAMRLVAPDENVRLGVSQLGVQYELGRYDDLQQTADRITDLIKGATLDSAEDVVREINSLVPGLSSGARLNMGVYGSLLTPLLIRSDTLRGVVSLNLNAQLQGAGVFRGSEAKLVEAAGVPTGKVTTASALDFKVAQITQASLGYSTDLLPLLTDAGGTAYLDAGVRLNAYQARLHRQTIGFVDAEGNASTFEFNRADLGIQRANATAVDLGLTWGDENYQVGATFYNLGSPRLQFPDPSLDPVLANAQAAQRLAAEGAITLDDAVVLKPHLVLEGSVFSQNKRWLAQASLATNETPNFVGEAQRYATASISYNAERFDGSFGTLMNYLVPSVRVGYRANLAGAKLSTTGLGLSWGVINLDLNISQQRIKADGVSVPRTAGLSFSVAEKF